MFKLAYWYVLPCPPYVSVNTEIAPVTDSAPFNTVRLMVEKIRYLRNFGFKFHYNNHSISDLPMHTVIHL